MTRDDTAHLRNMNYRKLACNAVIALDCTHSWKDAIMYPSILVDTKFYLPAEHVFSWERGLQARLTDDQENRKEYTMSRPARQVERWYGPAVVTGHAYDGEARIDAYWISFGGTYALVSGLHLTLAEVEERLATDAYMQDIRISLQAATHG